MNRFSIWRVIEHTVEYLGEITAQEMKVTKHGYVFITEGKPIAIFELDHITIQNETKIQAEFDTMYPPVAEARKLERQETMKRLAIKTALKNRRTEH